MDKSKLVDELQEIIYVSDVETYELLFANRYCMEVMTKNSDYDYSGKKCYEVLYKRNAPCEFCTNKLLSQNEFYTWEYTIPVINRHFLLRDKLTTWHGAPARLEIAVDITQQENLSQYIRQKLRTENTLVECIRLLTENRDLNEGVYNVMGMIAKYYEADRVYILELENEIPNCVKNTHEWRARHVPAQSRYLEHISLDDLPFWKNVISQRKVIILKDLDKISQIYPQETELPPRQSVHSIIAVPLMLDSGEFLGYISVENPIQCSNDPSLLQSFSYYLVNEIVKQRLQKELEYQNIHDSLTGLFNRAHYEKYLEKKDIRSLNSVGMTFCDINGLKLINDTKGHHHGDRLILQAATILKQCFADYLVFRLSGDEFFVICENIEQQTFKEIIEYARGRLKNETVFGVSLGAVWENQLRHTTFDDLTRKADHIMYIHKQNYYKENHVNRNKTHSDFSQDPSAGHAPGSSASIR